MLLSRQGLDSLLVLVVHDGAGGPAEGEWGAFCAAPSKHVGPQLPSLSQPSHASSGCWDCKVEAGWGIAFQTGGSIAPIADPGTQEPFSPSDG